MIMHVHGIYHVLDIIIGRDLPEASDILKSNSNENKELPCI